MYLHHGMTRVGYLLALGVIHTLGRNFTGAPSGVSSSSSSPRENLLRWQSTASPLSSQLSTTAATSAPVV